jgi:hypothetical protein
VGDVLKSAIENPTFREATELLENSFSKHQPALIVGSCRVDYVGRASSTLEWGERIVIVKADGSVLVHRPTGYEPVNWQPQGCLFQVDMPSEGQLRIRALRRQPREIVNIYFDRIRLIFSSRLDDLGDFYLHVSEEQMRDALLSRPEMLELNFKPIDYERKVEPGFVDVYGVDKDRNLVVVEIKRNPIGRDAVLQLKRYIDAIRKETGQHVRGMVVGPSLKKGAQTLLATLNLEFKQLSPKRCFELLEARKARKLSEFMKYES